jgi:hypothetical protein
LGVFISGTPLLSVIDLIEIDEYEYFYYRNRYGCR